MKLVWNYFYNIYYSLLKVNIITRKSFIPMLCRSFSIKINDNEEGTQHRGEGSEIPVALSSNSARTYLKRGAYVLEVSESII